MRCWSTCLLVGPVVVPQLVKDFAAFRGLPLADPMLFQTADRTKIPSQTRGLLVENSLTVQSHTVEKL